VLDLSACADLRWLANVVADIAATRLAQRPILVGALARDILLLHAHGIDTGRATEDADFGIAVASWDEYETAWDRLISSGAFAASRLGRQRIQHRQFGWVDLIPFGGVERPDGTIAWPPEAQPVMNVLGYQEANATAIQTALPGGQDVLVVSIPMLIVLKVLAWEDRHTYAPRKDANDLMPMLGKYLDAGNLPRLPADAVELLGDAFDYGSAGALLAGREANAVLSTFGARGEVVSNRVGAIVRRESDPGGELALAYEMAGTNAEEARRLLSVFWLGLGS
jgi:predicted nucleotidyltransferase